jgi:NAD-dependent deacetylase
VGHLTELSAQALAARLRTVQQVTVLTGAGISAESGVPTFRAHNGLWNSHRVEELASPTGFARDPKTVWEFYDWRRTVLAECVPNSGHRALAGLAAAVESLTVITQNVDGLHQAAGSEHVLEIHGSIWKVRCIAGCGEWEDRRPALPELPPRCACGALLRPAVVWFGEALPPERIDAATRAALSCQLFLVIGTSGVVEPAASLARWAVDAGAMLAEFNPEPTRLSHLARWQFRSPAGIALPQVVERLAV